MYINVHISDITEHRLYGLEFERDRADLQKETAGHSCTPCLSNGRLHALEIKLPLNVSIQKVS